jgi:hypothetical protein
VLSTRFRLASNQPLYYPLTDVRAVCPMRYAKRVKRLLTDLEFDLTITGFQTAQVKSPIVASWKVKGNSPSRPGLETRVVNEPPWASENSDSSTKETMLVIDASLMNAGRRWSDDERLEMLVLAMPLTVRLEGTGFLTVPPGERMPFGVDLDNDRLRVVFPLYLPESKLAGSVKIRPIKAGPFHLSVRRVTATSIGRLRNTDTLFDDTRELEDRSPAIIVQDKLTPDLPKALWSSPTGEFQLRVFDEYFEVFDSVSGGLVLDLFGTEPRFSPTSRFLSFKADSFLFVVDVGARELVLTMSTRYDEGVNSLSFVKGDAYLVAGGTSYGTVGVWSTLTDIEVGQRFADLLHWPLAEGGYVGEAYQCHACRMHPFEVFWNFDEGCIVVAHPGELLEAYRHNLFHSGISGFFVKSIVDRDLIILHPARQDTPFLRRTAAPSSLGVTYFKKWNIDYELPEEQRVVESILEEHLTEMKASTPLEEPQVPYLRGWPVLRDFGIPFEHTTIGFNEPMA